MREKPRKGARKIVVNNGTYWWYYGRQHVVIWSPSGSSHSYPDHVIAGMTPTDAERAQWKKYFSITPADIRKRIEEEGI